MKSVVLGAVIVLLTAGVVYGLVSLRYSSEIERTEAEIAARSGELISLLTTPAPPLPEPPAPTPRPVERNLTSGFCLKCHDKEQLSAFHYPERIKALEEAKGRRIRICTTCHGEPVMPVHFKAIQAGRARCEACHIRDGGPFTVPEKKEGDLLICQLCHARGNYITIHVDGNILEDAEIDAKWIRRRPGLECTVCHNEEMYGGRNVLDLHEEALKGAGTTPAGEGGASIPSGRVTAEWGSPAPPTAVVKVG